MGIELRWPSKLLAPYVKAYCIVESHSECTNRVLPDTSIVMAFNFKGHVSYMSDNIPIALPSSTLSGLRKSLRQFNYSKDAGNILVIFREAGAVAFFKVPLHGLYEDCVSLDNFIHRQKLLAISEEISEAKNNAERILLIEQLLVSQLCGHKQDELISMALQNMHSTEGNIKIKDLARSLYISQDAFEKRFRRVVGSSPKQFAHLLRLKSITGGARQKYKLSQIAFNAGFYDQAHFNKDFKLFTGQTPAGFFKSSSALQINDFLQ